VIIKDILRDKVFKNAMVWRVEGQVEVCHAHKSSLSFDVRRLPLKFDIPSKAIKAMNAGFFY
jgi:hypothetical protein